MKAFITPLFFLALVTLLPLSSNLVVYAVDSSDDEEFIEVYGHTNSTMTYGARKHPDTININFKKGEKEYSYSITSKEVSSAIFTAGKARKEKEKKAQAESPLLTTDTISLTTNEGGERKTKSVNVYQIKSKPDKRKFRNIIQNFFDKCKKSREDGTPRPASIVVQRGNNQKTDLSILRPGLDVSLSPLKVKDGKEYTASKPPAYGDEVDKASDAVKKTLKLAEGGRSQTASVLRHIAEKDSDFLGSGKGGAKKLRDYDKGRATKKDQESTMNSFAKIFIKKVEKKEIQKKKDFPSKDEILKEVIAELNTETDSPSFHNSDKKKAD
jgi:hypothetical protein